MITHYDLFAGIGGFSIAVDEVFDEPVRHIFCEWDSFCTQVLKKHWPDGEYWGDIAELVTHTQHNGHRPKERGIAEQKGSLPQEHRQEDSTTGQSERTDSNRNDNELTILTGGFPCQPFSAAGRRRGTADDRYKWPEMFAVIRNIKPQCVIAENVRGLVNWSDGLVLEQVCADLESEGYEVQPLIIPAVAKNAPHRRDRVWIIAHGPKHGLEGGGQQPELQKSTEVTGRPELATDSQRPRPPYRLSRQDSKERPRERRDSNPQPDWRQDWPEVAAELCLVDDGLSSQLVRLPDGSQISYPKWRKESLKAGGNAIVPQVAIEIMKAIKQSRGQ